MTKAVFLDRDGVLNKAFVRNGRPYPPSNIREFEIIDGVKEALYQLKDAGFILIVITNQPDVARGRMDRNIVENINTELTLCLPIDVIKVCYHDDDDCCTCRKPKPGAITATAKNLGIDLSQSYMIGDRWRDIGAGINAGCKTIFIDYGYQETKPVDFDHTVKNLMDATKIIIKETENG